MRQSDGDATMWMHLLMQPYVRHPPGEHIISKNSPHKGHQCQQGKGLTSWNLSPGVCLQPAVFSSFMVVGARENVHHSSL